MMSDRFLVLAESFLSADAASAIFLAGFFIVTGLLPLPRTILCLAAGAVCGIWAVLIIMPSTTVGASLAFFIARYYGAERLRRSIKNRPKSQAILKAVESEGWRAVALLRFWSPVPTAVQSYLFGLTTIDFTLFMITSFIFTIPQVTVYVYLGAMGRAALLHGLNYLNVLLAVLSGATLLILVWLVARKTATALQVHAAADLPADPSVTCRK